MVAQVDLTDEDRQGSMGALRMAFQYGQARDSKPGEAYFTKVLGFEDGFHSWQSAVFGAVAAFWNRAAAVASSPLAEVRFHALSFERRQAVLRPTYRGGRLRAQTDPHEMAGVEDRDEGHLRGARMRFALKSRQRWWSGPWT